MKKLTLLAAGLLATVTTASSCDKQVSDVDMLNEQASKARKIDATVNQTGTNINEAVAPEFTGPEGDPTKVWGFSLDDIEKSGGAKVFFEANKEALKAYADANGVEYKKNDKFLWIRFNSAVKLQVTKKSIADSEKNIADSEKNIADSEKRIADMNQAMLDKLKNRDKKGPSDKD